MWRVVAVTMSLYSPQPLVDLPRTYIHTHTHTHTYTAVMEYASPVWHSSLASGTSVRSAPSLLQFRRDLKTALRVSVIVLFTIVSSCVTDYNCNL